MHYFYIIYSYSTDSYYIGETRNLENRIKKRNNHTFQKAYTKKAIDWEYVLKYECSNRLNAQKIERFVKKMKSRIFIQKLINNPDIISKLPI